MYKVFITFLLLSVQASIMLAQEIEFLFHVIELKPTSYTQSGHLDVALATFNTDHQKVLQYSFSTLPSEVIQTDQQYKARWTAEKLKGIERIQIQTAIVFSKTNKVNIPVLIPSRSTGSTIKTLFQPSEIWNIISAKSLSNKYRFRFTDQSFVINSSLSPEYGPYVRSVKSYWTNASEKISELAYWSYNFERNQIASYLLEHLLNKDPENHKLKRYLAISLSRLGDRIRPMEILNKLKNETSQKKDLADIYYCIANYYAINHKKEKAVENLLAAKKVYKRFNLCYADKDHDFINLVAYQPFLDIIKRCN